MNSQNWQKVKDVFAEALEKSNGNRLEFLRERCGADAELFAEVKSLLDANAETEPLIEKNAFQLASKLNAGGKNYDFTKFGRYTVLKEIGRGGMGAVFLARRSDGAYEQQAALKIIRQNFVNDEIERHFRRERQILASLNHPNIAKLLDGGVSDAGELFLVMEYVEGETLTEYAKKQRLTIAEKLELFLKICRAVSFAHQNLVVHRDLKPSNILITKDGEPKLLDFGLAKITAPDENPFALENDSEQTKTLFRAFTPAYAAPEQIHGKTVTTASDVYSLGVILYELLTGAKPFQLEGKSLDEIFQTIDLTEPPKPSTVGNSRFSIQDSKSASRNPASEILNPKFLRGDLDNITLKALRKEPLRRYKSVEAFAADLERHLKNLPIKARPNTISYLASRFFRRNKIAVSATAFVILALISGLAVALWQAQIARLERDRAERRFSDVRQLSNSLLFELSPKIERLSGSTEARKILVSRALEYLDSLATESQNDSSLQSELAAAYEKIGDLQGNPNKPNLNDFAGAVNSFEKAQTIRRNFVQTTENQKSLAENYRVLSGVRWAQSDVKNAFADGEKSLEIYQNLTVENPAAFDLQANALETRIEYAQLYANNNQFERAIPLFQNILTSLAALDSRAAETQRLKAKTEAFLGNALSWNDRQTEAETEMAKATAEVEPLAAAHPNDADIQQDLWRIYMLASSIYETINDARALEFSRKALNVAENATALDGANTQAKQNLARTFSRVGIGLVLTNRLSEAAENLQKSKNILDEMLENEPENTAYQRDFAKLYIRSADLKYKQKNIGAALADYEKSVEFFEKVAQSDDKNTVAQRDLAQSLKNVGKVQTEIGDRAKAKQSFQRAFQILTDLKAKNALGEYDRPMFDEVQKALQKL